MASISLKQIADAIHHHLDAGTLDFDLLNSFLFPDTRITVNTSYPANTHGNGASKAKGKVDTTDTALSQSRHSMGPADTQADACEPSEPAPNTPPPADTAPMPAFPASLISHHEGLRSASTRNSHKRLLDAPTAPALPSKTRKALSKPGPSPEACTNDEDIASAQLLNAQLEQSPRSKVIDKWKGKIENIDEWNGMGKFAYIGDKSEQDPFAELDAIMARVFNVGSDDVRAAFARNVRAWVTSRTKPVLVCEGLPEHLEKNEIEGVDASLFRRLWNANQVVRAAKGVEDIAVIMRRKALLELATVYEEVIGGIRAAKNLGKSGLRHGQVAPAKAREILSAALYPGVEDRRRAKGLFEYNMKCASSYIFLRNHYGHDGILAMIPARINEKEIGISTRFPAILEFLDFLRPGLHGDFSNFCSGVIDDLFRGRPLSEETLERLDDGEQSWKLSSSGICIHVDRVKCIIA